MAKPPPFPVKEKGAPPPGKKGAPPAKGFVPFKKK